jgi:hypothetical protein
MKPMNRQDKNLSQIDNVEIDALSDEDLEDAAGGCISNSCSSKDCSNATVKPALATAE